MYEPIVERSVVQQLDDLPVKAVVIDRDGDAWQRRKAGWHAAMGPKDSLWHNHDDNYETSQAVGNWAPLHLVYNPDHHR